MSDSSLPNFRFHDLKPPPADLRRVFLDGLTRRPKRTPAWLLYDAEGSRLFEQILKQPEYYIPRVERALLAEHARAMRARLGPDALIIEPGAGGCEKIQALLATDADGLTYAPMDVSGDALHEAARRVAKRFPYVQVEALAVNFLQPFAWPAEASPVGRRACVFFPGSTIGNYEPEEAVELMRGWRAWTGDDGGALVGVDLQKDPAVVEHAYNDDAGVTAAFSRNLIAHMNRALGAVAEPSRFRHYAVYNAELGRIETRLVCDEDCEFELCGETIRFDAGESVHIENSYKFTVDSFAALASKAGFHTRDLWTDADGWFAYFYLTT